MKKRILAICLVVAMAATAIVGASMAYLTDTDSDVNVMTLGNVQIEQFELQRAEGVSHINTGAEQGDLVPFVQGQTLYPTVPTADDAYEAEQDAEDCFHWGVYSPGWNGLWDDSKLANVMDKFVFVKNTGKSDAYYRTLIALECPEDMTIKYAASGAEIEVNINGNTRFDWDYDVGFVTIEGTRYAVWSVTYNEILTPGETSRPSLLQVILTHHATNEDMELLGDTYDILVLSQAVQAAGFDSADAALDTAFGDVTAEKAAEWLGALNVPTVVEVSTPEALASAIKDNTNAIIKLADGNYTTNLKIDGGKNITITGSKDAVLSGQIATTASNAGTLKLQGVTVNVDSIVDSTGISQTGKSAIAVWGDQTVICENVTFNMSLADSTAITSWWDTGVGTTIIARNCTFNCNGQRPIRATGNVTVENCTFNDPYRYAVQLTAKSSTATLLDKAVVNFNNNTIVNGENGKAFVYGIQLEGADYGCHDLIINGSGNKITDGGTESTMYYCECGKVDHDTVVWNTEVTAVHES